MKVPPVVHFLGKNAIRLVLLLIFVGIPATAWYLREVGIGFGAKEALGRELSRGAVRISIGRLSFDPFSGLQAGDVVIEESQAGGRSLARLSNVTLALNLSELVSGRIVVDRLLLSGASVSIPLHGAEDSGRISLTDVFAEVILLGDRLRLSRFDGTFEGIRIVLSGQFINPHAFHPGETFGSGGGGGDSRLVERILGELSAVRFTGTPPVLQAEIDADFAVPESLRVSDVRFRTGGIHGKGWSVGEVDVRGEFEKGMLRIPHFVIRDDPGALEASLQWTPATGSFDGALISTLAPDQFLALARKDVALAKELAFPEPPRLEARIVGETPGGTLSMRVTGLADIPAMQVKGVPFTGVGFSFAWRDGLLFVRDIRASATRGRMTGKLWIAPGDFRVSAQNSIPPTELVGIFDPPTRAFLEKMEFKDLPEISLALTGKKPDFPSLRGSGNLKLGRTSMRGAWIDSAVAGFELGDRCITYKDFIIRRGDGRGTGSFAYDVGKQEARLNGIRSTLVPTDVLMWIDPKIAEAVAPYRFISPPTALVDGMVHLKDPTKNNLSIGVESAAGLDYDLLGKTLRFGKTSAQVNVVGPEVRANIKNARLMGGNAALTAIVSIDPKDPTFGVDLTLSRVDFAKLTKLYFDYDTSKGVLSGNFKFDAIQGKENLMKGAGRIRVEDGNVFAIPILGPFSEILGPILPGVGYQTARLATASFTVANETIHTPDLVIEGAGFSMLGNGDIHFMTSRLDMNMRVNAKGIPGIVFYPVSKLFEYVSTGTVADPGWRPKLIPRLDGDGNGNGGNAPKPGRR